MPSLIRHRPTSSWPIQPKTLVRKIFSTIFTVCSIVGIIAKNTGIILVSSYHVFHVWLIMSTLLLSVMPVLNWPNSTCSMTRYHFIPIVYWKLLNRWKLLPSILSVDMMSDFMWSRCGLIENQKVVLLNIMNTL